MKLFIMASVGLGVFAMLLLTGCGGGGSSAPNPQASPAVTAAPQLLSGGVLIKPARSIPISDTEKIPVLTSADTLTINCFFTHPENFAAAPRASVYDINGRPFDEARIMTASPAGSNGEIRYSYTGQIVYIPEAPEVQGLKLVSVSWQDKDGTAHSQPIAVFHYGLTPSTSVPTLLDSRAETIK